MRSDLHHRLSPLLALAAILCGDSPVAEAQTSPTLKTEAFRSRSRLGGAQQPDRAEEAADREAGLRLQPDAFRRQGRGRDRRRHPALDDAGFVRRRDRARQDARRSSLSASGSFAVTGATPGAGVFFGFFNSQQPGGSGRPIGSLGLNFDFEGKGGRLAVRLITGSNKSCGTFITPYLPGKFRPTPIKNDGTRYHWTLDYDPQAAGGNGRFTFTMRSDTHTTEDYGSLPPSFAKQEAQARFPNTTTFTVDLTPGYKKEGATFDRFGVLNMMKSGGAATIFFDDRAIQRRDAGFRPRPGVGSAWQPRDVRRSRSGRRARLRLQRRNEPRGRRAGRSRRRTSGAAAITATTPIASGR